MTLTLVTQRIIDQLERSMYLLCRRVEEHRRYLHGELVHAVSHHLDCKGITVLKRCLKHKWANGRYPCHAQQWATRVWHVHDPQQVHHIADTEFLPELLSQWAMRDGRPFHVLLCEQSAHCRARDVESTTFISEDPAPTACTCDVESTAFVSEDPAPTMCMCDIESTAFVSKDPAPTAHVHDVESTAFVSKDPAPTTCVCDIESTAFVSEDPAPTAHACDGLRARIGCTLAKAGDDAPGTRDHHNGCLYIRQDVKRCSKEM